MTILALEFSSPQRSVAVVRASGVTEAIEAGGHGTNAFSLIEKVLAEAGIRREQIEVIAVGLGPGSYTGIRVALSIAQGWQLARGVKLLGVSSAECLAVQAQAEKIFGRVNVVIDAQRNEFYLASYEISPDRCEEVKPLKIVPLIERQSCANTGEIWVGPEATRWLPMGKILFPSAATLGRLATGRADFASGDQLAPIYLREVKFVKAPPPNPMAF
jgi:tRNA threonylcarbamoyladenosine biosynthesis protein TsaB